jgi:hypothetical protein
MKPEPLCYTSLLEVYRMSQRLTLELSDDAYEAIERAAEPTGQRPAEWVAMKLRQQLSAPGKGFRARFFRRCASRLISSGDVDVLEESIAAGKLPVKWQPMFDEEMGNQR